ncbi:MAG: anthranilate phosphoribosyltransferase [Fibrobacterota bacterium]
MLQNTIKKLADGRHLTEAEAAGAMSVIMEGAATPAQIASFITALRVKGETVDEIAGCARIMREKAVHISPAVANCVDTCGTGGDGAQTFNVSTAAAFAAAAAGAAVAKHGNRSVSSRCGSADVLEALGVNIALTPRQVEACIETTGIGFLFAPSFHPSMKHAAGPRKELGIRTVFNVLGPLTNPAGACAQVLGVFNAAFAAKMAEVLARLGTDRALVVHGGDGLDEITVTAPTFVHEVNGADVKSYEIEPSHFGLSRALPETLKGGDAAQNAEIILSIFQGEKGPRRDIVVLNAAAALYAAKKADSLKTGVAMAGVALDAGLALKKLEALKAFTAALKS